MMYGHKSAKKSTSALLQKVNSQLRGEKSHNYHEEDDDEDELGDYLNTLGRKKKSVTSQPQWDKFGEISDFSASEEDRVLKPRSTEGSTGATGSKFLKKKPKEEPKNSLKQLNKGNVPGRGSRVTSEGHGAPGHGIQGQKNTSGVLSKAAAYTNKYYGGPGRGGSQTDSQRPQVSAVFSDSDMDISLSMDEDIMADVKSWKKTNSAPNKSSQNWSTHTHPAPDSDDSSSVQVGRGGSKFLKKKPVSQGQEEEGQNNKENIPLKNSTVKKKPSGLTVKSAEKYSTKVVLDTDEESLAEMIGMLSDSSSATTPREPTTPRGILKSPWSPARTPRSPRTPRGAMMEHIVEEREDSDGDSVSSEESFRMNVMDLDDLEPVLEMKPDVSKKSKSTTSSNKSKTGSKPAQRTGKSMVEQDPLHLMGLQTIDDLLPPTSDLSIALTTGSEIHTEAEDYYESDFDPLTRSGRSPTPLKSILATTPRNLTPRSSRSRVRYSLAEVTEVKSRSPSPEVISTARGSRTASLIRTESVEDPSIATEISTARSIPEEADEDYSEDYTEDFSLQSGLSSPDRTPRSSLYRRGSDAYSDDFTGATDYSRTTRDYSMRDYSRSSSRESYSDGYTSTSTRSRTPSPDRKPRKATETACSGVQTGQDMGLLYHWDTQTSGSAVMGPQYGMAFVDPTPIATHVVSAEALEAVTGFSPSVLALNDMLRQQLNLTTQYLNMQKRLHQQYDSVIVGDHQYTTLEDTKKYIEKNRRPTLSFKQALKQVKKEMGLHK